MWLLCPVEGEPCALVNYKSVVTFLHGAADF